MSHLKKLQMLADTQHLPEWYSHKLDTNYWGARCVLQLEYALKLSESEGNLYHELIFQAIDLAFDAYKADGAITTATCKLVEQALAPLSEKCKQYSLLCVAHAHIDMNWQWGYDETVAITIDTFRTMLDLMNEYPDFIFAQSQASVYKIVEEHCPEMLEEIKQRVHEGRWEVIASTWVEADRNMPNLESMARHLLYTKQYLSQLLDIDPSTLNFDFEPDTFGHSINVPEILCDGGVNYYYHCRGFDQHALYRWQAPSGRSIIAYREFSWYNWMINGYCAHFVPEFCKTTGMKSMLRVYGVGDHGGGPTRRDIDRIHDMNTWPIFPQYKLSTYQEFYKQAEEVVDTLPVVEGELNFIFDGCYSSQSRQKKGNRFTETALAQAEGLNALANIALGTKYDTSKYTGAWQKVLFNQFHDMLPGSGVVDTREYAMGMYQEVLATANTKRSFALRAVSEAIDTSEFITEEDSYMSRSEGAGVGYGVDRGLIAPVGRHFGVRRLFTVYNPLPYERDEMAEIIVWDWNGNLSNMCWTDANHNKLSFDFINQAMTEYCGHLCTTVLVKVCIPAMGYTTVILDELEPETISFPTGDLRLLTPPSYVLENEYIRAQISPSNGDIISLIDKKSGIDYATPSQPIGVYRLVEESPVRGMSSWTVGQYMNIHSLNRGVKFVDSKIGSGLNRQSASYCTAFGHGSRLNVTVSLDKGAQMLRFETEISWQEIGTRDTFYPQLNFHVPVNYSFDAVRYDVPGGILDRPPYDMDMPALSYGMPINKDGRSLMIISDSKYGYRGDTSGLSLTLLRSSVDPDPWPEIAEHRMRFAIAFSDNNATTDAMTALSFCNKLMVVASRAHKGILPASQSFVQLIGSGVLLSAIKLSEDGSGMIARYYEIDGKNGEAKLELYHQPTKAIAVNLLEQPTDEQVSIDGNGISFHYKANSVGNIKISF